MLSQVRKRLGALLLNSQVQVHSRHLLDIYQLNRIPLRGDALRNAFTDVYQCYLQQKTLKKVSYRQVANDSHYRLRVMSLLGVPTPKTLSKHASLNEDVFFST